MSFGPDPRRAHRAPLSVRLYAALLVAVLACILGATVVRGADLTRDASWIWLGLVFAFSEYAMLLFHHQRGRQGLSAAEAVLLPMIVALSFPEAVWGVTLATILVNVARRVAPLKAVFNVAEYGCATAAAAGLWTLYRQDQVTFGPANALLAVFSVLVFAFLTHVLVTVAISLAERRTLAELSRDIAPAIGFNLAGNVTLGVLFAAAYSSAAWTVALFPFAIGALYLGYRAVMKQTLESERVAHLHAASRALAATPDLNRALADFLLAVAEIASATEARVAVVVKRELRWTGVRSGEVVADLETVDHGPLAELVAELERRRRPLVVEQGDATDTAVLDRLGCQSVVAVPLLEAGEVVGALLALDRVGADSFGESDAQVLEALGSELVLTLDSYRLFGEISDERERFARIFRGSKEGICLLDERGVVRAWNPALEQITGYSADDMNGSRWWDKLVIRDDGQRRIEGDALLGVDAETPLELLTREGPARWVAVAAEEVGPGDERGWVVLIRDVTAQHEAEQAKSDFLATISHELRTPLTTIKGSLQVLERGASGLPPETVDQMVDVLGRGADRLERLVMNLLFVSQLERGSVTVVRDELDLQRLLVKRLRRWDERRIAFVDEAPGLIVRADKEKLGQTIDHLLDNAFKYGGDGTVTVTLRRVNGFGRVEVRDEGPGIAAVDKDRIFDRFVRLGDTLTRESQGAGVGLFIAKRSVEAMGGRISVESGRGRGATFVVDIPLARPMVVEEPGA